MLRENADVCAAAIDDPACANGPRAAHNVEGAAVFLGDLFARAGDVEAARSAYESALTTPGYATWDHQDLLADRIATVEMRAALSQDADPSNDPVLVTSSTRACSICHQE